jgi:hypothetical protein
VCAQTRPHSAIETGRCEASVDTVARDDACAFGQWLYGDTAEELERFISAFTLT